MVDYRTSIDIAAPPQVVFDHLITAERMVCWMGQHAELDPRPGGRFAVDINGTPIRGHYLEIDPPRRIVVSWGVAGNSDFPPGTTRVEFTLTPTDTGTRLDLTHRDLNEPWATGHASGWPHYLTQLQHAASQCQPTRRSAHPGPARP